MNAVDPVGQARALLGKYIQPIPHTGRHGAPQSNAQCVRVLRLYGKRDVVGLDGVGLPGSCRETDATVDVDIGVAGLKFQGTVVAR